MAQYTYLDNEGMQFLLTALLTKLQGKLNQTYSFEKEGNTIYLVDAKGTRVSSVVDNNAVYGVATDTENGLLNKDYSTPLGTLMSTGSYYDLTNNTHRFAIPYNDYTIMQNIVNSGSYTTTDNVKRLIPSAASTARLNAMSAKGIFKTEDGYTREILTETYTNKLERLVDDGLFNLLEDGTTMEILKQTEVAKARALLADGIYTSDDNIMRKVPSKLETENLSNIVSTGAVTLSNGKTAYMMSSDERTKLGGIANGAQVNVIDAITVNGTSVTISGKTAKITVLTSGQVETQILAKGYKTEEEINALIATAVSQAQHLKYAAVDTLPSLSAADLNTMYAVPDGSGSRTEYMIKPDRSGWDIIGSTTVDLSNYVQKVDLVAVTNAEITSAVNAAYTAVFG